MLKGLPYDYLIEKLVIVLVHLMNSQHVTFLTFSLIAIF